MSVFAAVITGKGTGAIATIQLYGDSAEAILKQIFVPQTQKTSEFATGKILLGTITTNGETIDQVTIGCEGPDTFAINCHGNPLIVEQIMCLLQKQGIELLTAEQLLCKTFADGNTITLEAKLMLPKTKTIEGTKIILNQTDSGLAAAAKNWVNNINLNKITSETKTIIKASRIAKLIIFGCRIVLAGPPNTGKSTLLNRLSGRQKAIVTDIKGTTRDWVSANCQIGPLAVELIDTAGLDEKLADDIDKAAKQAAVELINQADLVLLVLDNSEPIQQLTTGLIEKLADRKVLTVLNKSDLPARFDPAKLPGNAASSVVQISALLGTGIDALARKICEITGTENFDVHQPVCFTARQEQLLIQLTNADSQGQAIAIITELLSGRLNV
jgi:tRNA modification GTPase